MNGTGRRGRVRDGGIVVLGLAAGLAALACGALWADWPSWRGPDQDGNAPDTPLVSRWSPAGENLLWRADMMSRSTPVVVDGRVCVNGRVGAGLTRRESVACFEAASGRKLWEHDLDVYLTAVPWSRVGWGNLTADRETGYVFELGVGGLLYCFAPDGKVVWWHSLGEEYGLISGVGGRTHSPLVDEDRLLVSFVNAGWGEQGVLRHRTFAFDKRTGELMWVATPGEQPQDTNIQTTPVVAQIDGRRLVIEGNADGWIYALEARTGRKVWGFHLSKGAMNNTVEVHGHVVFAAHGEENLDTGLQGRVVAIDGRGSGDLTGGHELWRNDDISSTFASPLYHDGVLYVVDNAGGLSALDAATGKELWRHKLGTSGKASPVWADGKIYVAEVNGRFDILKPTHEGVQVLDEQRLRLADGSRFAEVYGSPAVAYGRLYLAAESGLYCLGDRSQPLRGAHDLPAAGAGGGGARAAAAAAPAGPVAARSAAAGAPASPAASAAGVPTQLAAAGPALEVIPAEVLAAPGEAVHLRAVLLDARGLPVADAGGPHWSLENLGATLDSSTGAAATLTADPARGFQTGAVVVELGGARARARVRIAPPLPWRLDFKDLAPGTSPAGWVGAASKYVVKQTPGGKVLAKSPVARGLNRSNVSIGPPSLANYTIQADLSGAQDGFARPDMGVIAGGYILDLQGAAQHLQLRAWDTELRLMREVPFSWQPGIWYTMKLSADVHGGKGLIRGKVWRRGDPEPADWTVAAEDPQPVPHSSPGLYGYSAAEILYDNVSVVADP